MVLRGAEVEASMSVVVVETSLLKVAPVRANAASWDFVLYPAEKPLSGESPVKSIQLHYPPSQLGGVWGFPLWLWIFFVVSIAAGFALKGVFRVEV